MLQRASARSLGDVDSQGVAEKDALGPTAARALQGGLSSRIAPRHRDHA